MPKLALNPLLSRLLLAALSIVLVMSLISLPLAVVTGNVEALFTSVAGTLIAGAGMVLLGYNIRKEYREEEGK